MTLEELIRGSPIVAQQPSNGGGEEVVVNTPPTQGPRIKRGFIGGPFALGTTGGNILGAIGDGLLATAGRRPVYSPRLDNAAQAEALQDYRVDPDGALDKLTQIAPGSAVELMNERSKLESERAVRDSMVEERRVKRADRVNEIATRLAGSATKDTWPTVRDRIQKFFVAQGVDPYFDLPESWDEAQVQALRMSGVPTEDQISQESTDEDRSERRRLTAERNAVSERQGDARIGISAQRAAVSNANSSARTQDARRRTDAYIKNVESQIQTRANGGSRGGPRRVRASIANRK